jgi:uncharacterized membrane protein (DUF373 family)
MIETIRQKLLAVADYERFEHAALRYVQLLLAAITLFAMVLVTIDLVRDFGLGEQFMEKEVLQDTFGSIFIVLILLEFNHSLHLAIKHRAGAVQVRMVVLIAVLVIARKLMLLDYATVDIRTLLGFAVLLLALGGLYWLISHSDARHQPAGKPEPTPPPPLAGEG